MPGANPELLGEGANLRAGRLPNILIIDSQKPYKFKENLVRRGGGGAPLRSATECYWKISNIPFSHLSLFMNCNQHNKLHSFNLVPSIELKKQEWAIQIPKTGIVSNLHYALWLQKSDGCVPLQKLQTCNASEDLFIWEIHETKYDVLECSLNIPQFTKNMWFVQFSLFNAYMKRK